MNIRRCGRIVGIVMSMFGLGMASSAHAVMELTFTVNGSSVTVVDGGVGDLNPVEGNIVALSPDLVGFGGATITSQLLNGLLDIALAGVYQAGSTISVVATEDFLIPNPVNNIGVSLTANNAGLGVTTETVSISALGGGPTIASVTASTDSVNGIFTGYAPVIGGLSGGYRLQNSLSFVSTGSGGGLISIDGAAKVPEPASIALLGVGLVAFGALRRRRQQS